MSNAAWRAHALCSTYSLSKSVRSASRAAHVLCQKRVLSYFSLLHLVHKLYSLICFSAVHFMSSGTAEFATHRILYYCSYCSITLRGLCIYWKLISICLSPGGTPLDWSALEIRSSHPVWPPPPSVTVTPCRCLSRLCWHYYIACMGGSGVNAKPTSTQGGTSSPPSHAASERTPRTAVVRIYVTVTEELDVTIPLAIASY